MEMDGIEAVSHSFDEGWLPLCSFWLVPAGCCLMVAACWLLPVGCCLLAAVGYCCWPLATIGYCWDGHCLPSVFGRFQYSSAAAHGYLRLLGARSCDQLFWSMMVPVTVVKRK